MREQTLRSVVGAVCLTGILCVPCAAMRILPDRAAVEAEAKLIEGMVAGGDVEALYDPSETICRKAARAVLNRAYMQAAAETTEPWCPDAPYAGLKGRYSYLLACKTLEGRGMKEAYELAQMLESMLYDGWSAARRDVGDPNSRDQYVKAVRLYRHIVDHCPANEFIVYGSKERIDGLMFNLTGDVKCRILRQIETFSASNDYRTGLNGRKRRRGNLKSGSKCGILSL